MSGLAVRNLPALTGVRGVAALWIFFHHWNLLSCGTNRGSHPLAAGYLAVDLFFVLSGFVMTHSRYSQFRRPDLGEYATYLGERLVRLYPTNAAAVGLYAAIFLLAPAVVAGDVNATFSLRSFLGSLTLTEAWPLVGQGGWIAPAWSVSLEILAYCVLPLLLVSVRALTPRVCTIVAVGCFLTFVLAVLANGDHDPNVKNRGGMIRLACEFSAGCVLYRLWRAGQALPVLTASVAAVSLLAVAITTDTPELRFLALPAFALIVLLSAQGTGVIAATFSSPAAQYLGRISYSLYLIHWPALIIFRHFGGLAAGPSLLMPFTLTVLAAATSLHYAVERPSHRLARRFRKTPAAPSDRSADDRTVEDRVGATPRG